MRRSVEGPVRTRVAINAAPPILTARALGRVLALAICSFPPAATALGGMPPALAIVGGAGMAGGTVSATLVLRGSPGATSATAEIEFPNDILGLLFEDCAVAPRLDATHDLEGAAAAGELVLAVEPSGPPAPAPLGDGDLASCDFVIRAGVPAGTVSLTVRSANLTDALGTTTPVDGENGFIVVIDPGATPTKTSTPIPPATPTSTPTETVTSTPPPTFTVRSASAPSGCVVAEPTPASPLAIAVWLPAFLLLRRRQRHFRHPGVRRVSGPPRRRRLTGSICER